MVDRIVIEATGDIPDDRKFAILAGAEAEIQEWVKAFNERYKVTLLASVRPVRPGKGKTPATPAPEINAADPANPVVLAPGVTGVGGHRPRADAAD